MFFNNFVSGPTSPGNYQQPNVANPAGNPAVANFPVGANPLAGSLRRRTVHRASDTTLEPIRSCDSSFGTPSSFLQLRRPIYHQRKALRLRRQGGRVRQESSIGCDIVISSIQVSRGKFEQPCGRTEFERVG